MSQESHGPCGPLDLDMILSLPLPDLEQYVEGLSADERDHIVAPVCLWRAELLKKIEDLEPRCAHTPGFAEAVCCPDHRLRTAQLAQVERELKLQLAREVQAA
jgi:hypothetical protein